MPLLGYVLVAFAILVLTVACGYFANRLMRR